LQHGVDPNTPDNRGLTALHLARTSGTIKALLNAGADVHVRTQTGLTPLQTVESCDNMLMLRRLLDAQADINAADRDGNTALLVSGVE
jgi:ankyrin repeat protein